MPQTPTTSSNHELIYLPHPQFQSTHIPLSPTPISFSQKIVNEVTVAVTEIFETKILANMPIQQRTQVWADVMVELTDQLVRRNIIHCK